MAVDKIYTDYLPLLDEIVYNLKKICVDIVVKDEDRSNNSETITSMKAADLYALCVEGNARFDLFEYKYDDLINVGVPEDLLNSYYADLNSIPDRFKNAMTRNKVSYYLSHYVEYNNYYRTLNGLPDYGTDGVYLNESQKAQIPKSYNLDLSKCVHELDVTTQDLLYTLGIVDELYSQYKYKYLLHLGSRKIDIYKARKADRFELLYIPSDIPKEIYTRFLDKYQLNRSYVLETVYSDAYKYGSDNYDDFIKLFITISTMIDIVTELPDFIIKRDIFDIKTIKLLFESSGIDYFYEIPFKYQLAMVKNINRLIKYKATTQNIVDICSLFGCDNIEVFKYYILKVRKKDTNGEYINILDENGNPDDSNYDLKFLKVPINEMADNYLYDNKAYEDYDEITMADKYWDGGYNHEYIKKEILKQEFNYLNSKYVSIDTIYSFSEITFQQIYFYNMIFDDVTVEEKLTLKVPSIDAVATFRLTDILSYLFALMYINYRIKDKLMNSTSKILSIKGFNFKANMQALANYLDEKGYTLEELGISDFQIENTDILTYNRLMEIFTKNTKIYNHVVHEMINADNKDIYDIYKHIYDALMLKDLTDDFFKLSNGSIAETYTDFLKERDIILYNSLNDIRNISSDEIRQTRINDIIGDTVYILEQYVKTTDFKYIFSMFPTVSAESIKQYLYKVINFFKSYKIQIHNISTIYKFDDQLENKIMIIDKIILNYNYTKQDTIEAISKMYNTVHLTKEDKVDLIEKTYMEVIHQIEKFLQENITLYESFKKMNVNLYKEDSASINEVKNTLCTLNKNLTIEIMEAVEPMISLKKKETVSLIEKVYKYSYHVIDNHFNDFIKIEEKANKTSTITKEDIFDIYDSVNISVYND